MTRAVVIAFHKYTPFGGQYYEPILTFFLQQMRKFKDEYDVIHIIDSTWNIDIADPRLDGLRVMIHKINPSLRYYDAYKEVLPQIQENLVLFMDNDMIVYKESRIRGAFLKLESSIRDSADVVSIIDEIGHYKTDKLKNGNKFCPYWFATRKDLLMKYLDVDWAPDMPYCETLGHLTEKMLEDGVKVYEQREDKSNVLFDGTSDGKKSKDLGYYHVRAGSTPAYLLATKKYGDINTYNDYIKNQPRSEYIRQFGWYLYMLFVTDDIDNVTDDVITALAEDVGLTAGQHIPYMKKFFEYHGLE